jgi:hypothetical protein
MRNPTSTARRFASPRHLAALAAWLILASGTSTAEEFSIFLSDDPIGVPMRVRNFTYPSLFFLGFAPAPAAPLGKRTVAIELHYSKVNYFQTSPSVEDYLRQSRHGIRRALDAADVDAIAAMPAGEGFYFDGEIDYAELFVHWGLTDRLDLSLAAPYIGFSGGILDGIIYDFHDALGLGQAGRNHVQERRFQAVFTADGTVWEVHLDRPSSGGFGDPSVYLRYAIPSTLGHWRFSVGGGVKAPIADADAGLSTGAWDVGMLLTADLRLPKNALILNLGYVVPGTVHDIGVTGTRDIDLPDLSSLHLSWIHRFDRWKTTRTFVQVLLSEHPLREFVDSDLSDPEFQITFGLKWATRAGVFGVGLTENLFNFANTPDIGIHLSWGNFFDWGRNKRRGVES